MNETTVSDFTSTLRTQPLLNKSNELELLNCFLAEQLHSEQSEEIELREDSLKITSFTKNIEESIKNNSVEQNLVSSTEFDLNNRSHSFNHNGNLKDFIFDGLGKRRRKEELFQNSFNIWNKEKKIILKKCHLKKKNESNFDQNQPMVTKIEEIVSKKKTHTKINGAWITSVIAFVGLLMHMVVKIRENDPIYQEDYKKNDF